MVLKNGYSKIERSQKMEKINKEVSEIRNNESFIKAIAKHIIAKCESDTEYLKRVELEEKKLEECSRYIMSEARRKAGRANMAATTEEEVYQIVDDYYLKDNLKIEVSQRNVAQVTKAETETAYAKVDAPPAVEVIKPEKKPLTPKPKERDPVRDNQVSLFDLLG